MTTFSGISVRTNDKCSRKDRDYKKSQIWKCSVSPTRVHSFILDGNNQGECIYCGDDYMSELRERRWGGNLDAK